MSPKILGVLQPPLQLRFGGQHEDEARSELEDRPHGDAGGGTRSGRSRDVKSVLIPGPGAWLNPPGAAPTSALRGAAGDICSEPRRPSACRGSEGVNGARCAPRLARIMRRTNKGVLSGPAPNKRSHVGATEPPAAAADRCRRCEECSLLANPLPELLEELMQGGVKLGAKSS